MFLGVTEGDFIDICVVRGMFLGSLRSSKSDWGGGGGGVVVVVVVVVVVLVVVVVFMDQGWQRRAASKCVYDFISVTTWQRPK